MGKEEEEEEREGGKEIIASVFDGPFESAIIIGLKSRYSSSLVVDHVLIHARSLAVS